MIRVIFNALHVKMPLMNARPAQTLEINLLAPVLQDTIQTMQVKNKYAKNVSINVQNALTTMKLLRVAPNAEAGGRNT